MVDEGKEEVNRRSPLASVRHPEDFTGCARCGQTSCYHCAECLELCWEHKPECKAANGAHTGTRLSEAWRCEEGEGKSQDERQEQLRLAGSSDAPPRIKAMFALSGLMDGWSPERREQAISQVAEVFAATQSVLAGKQAL